MSALQQLTILPPPVPNGGEIGNQVNGYRFFVPVNSAFRVPIVSNSCAGRRQPKALGVSLEPGGRGNSPIKPELDYPRP